MIQHMKQQILVLHGGDAYETYDEYLDSLRTSNVTLERVRSKGWKANLQQELGENFDVIFPKMPNAQNARYIEWKLWFDNIVPLLDDDLILVGHSLGGIFTVKYLSENEFPKLIKSVLLVGTPYNTPTRHPLVDFVITSPLDRFVAQANKIIIYHSKDDKVVPFSNAKQFHKEIPGSELRVFEDRGHFNAESFPEMVKDIKNM